MMILNLSESLAKPLVMAKLNMAYLSSLKNRAKLLSSYLPVSPSRVLRAPGTSPYHWCRSTKNRIFVWSRISKFLRPAQRYDDFKLIRITCQAACHGKTEHGIFVKFKKPSKTAVVLLAGVTISVLRAPGTSPYHLVPKHQKIEIFVWSRISKFLRPAQRYDDFKLIRITCQAACHGKTEHGIFVKFKKPSKTAVVLLAGVTISGTPCPRHFTVPFGAEAPKNRNFCMVPYLQIFAPGAAL